ncbi:Methionine-r-sulfoxide reductase, partial [Globisporangium splendens]
MAVASERVNRSDAEWKARLTPLQYQVLRLKGTEPAGSGEYDAHFAASGTHLGHVIRGEGYKTPTDERHCINSVSIVFHDDIVATEPSA